MPSNTLAVIDRLQAERSESEDYIEHVMEAVADESRDMSETETRAVTTHRDRIAEIDGQISPLVEFERTRASAVEVDSRISATRAVARRPHPEATPEALSLGGMFTDSEQFRNYSGGGNSGRFTIPGEVRAVLTTGATPGSGFLPAPTKWTPPAPQVVTPLLDVITRVPVSTGSVDIVTYSQAATGANVVAEGALKPEGALTAASVNTPLETIAAWIEITRQLLADAPAARAMIDSQLTRGILNKLSAQVAAVIAASSIPTTTGTAGQDALTVVRTGMATVQAAGFSPTVVLGSPALIGSLDVAVMAYGLGGPTVQNSVWGIRAVAVPGMTNRYVMDAAACIVLFERTNGVEVYMTDSDVTGAGVSGFKSNIFTILAELRAKSAVVNPTAATKIVVTP